MPRQGRINIEGGIYHIIQRGLERRRIFKDEKDREDFLRRLSEGLKLTGHQCYGWVLMDNHFHLVIRTSTSSLSNLLRTLLTGYAIYFNKKYKRAGYLYQNRYKSILCQEDTYLLELIRYVHLNPLRANIVKNISELGNYKWSGHSVLVGKQEADWQNQEDILSCFGKNKSQAIKKYMIFVSEAKDMGKRADLTGGGMFRSFGGWKEICKMKKQRESWQSDERMLGESDFVAQVLKTADENMKQSERLKKEGWTLERVVNNICERLNVEKSEVYRECRRSDAAKAKSLIVFFVNQKLGISGAELARHFRISRASISVAIKRGRKLADENEYLII